MIKRKRDKEKTSGRLNKEQNYKEEDRWKTEKKRKNDRRALFDIVVAGIHPPLS